MGRSWNKRWRNEDEPRDSKAARERNARQLEAAAGLLWTGHANWTARAEKTDTLCGCGKIAMSKAVAIAKAALLSRPGDVVGVYPCSDGRAGALGVWHARDETKNRRNKAKRRRGNRQAVRHRNRLLRNELPLRTWDDDGGASTATWLATGQLREEENGEKRDV